MPHVQQNDALKDKNSIALQRYEFAIECLKDSDIKEVIDLGCGMGYGTYMLGHNHNVLGVDFCQKAIDYANKNYPGNYRVEDLEDPEAHTIFEADAVVCLEVLCQLKDPKNFISRIKAKELVISAPIDPDPNDGYKYRLNISARRFRRWMKVNGWEIINELKQKKYLTIHARKI